MPELTKTKLEQRRTGLESDISRLEQTLANPGFQAKAPAQKVAEMTAKLSDLRGQLATVESELSAQR